MKFNEFCLILISTCLMLLLLASPHAVLSGTKGKIVGKVTDAQTGEPLPGVNVIIEGTTMGAATDEKGNYLILNIPPGRYTLRAQMIGYKTQRVENIHVSIDLTTTVNFSLESTVLAVGETVTVVAERPLIQMDMTSSMSAVGAEQIEDMPVEEMHDVLELQAGLVRDPFGGLHIRGGRSGEIAYWIDGIAATDVYSGDLGVEVENVAIQELQVVSGTFNAEYGQAMSGIVNIVTKEGGNRYDGQVTFYLGDYISRDKDIFLHIDDVNPLATRNLQASLSGPLPFTNQKVTFFTTTRYYYNQGWLFGQRWFTPQGLKGDSAYVPMNPFRKITGQTKLTWRVSPTMKLSYNVLWNQNKFKFYDHYFKYNPDANLKRFEKGLTHIVTLNHVLSPKTFYEFRLTRFYTDYKHYLYENPLDSVAYVRDPEDTTRFLIDPRDAEGYVHPDSLLAPAPWSFARAGTPLHHFKRSTSYWVGKFDLTSQVTPRHQLKAGFEVRFHRLFLEEFSITPRLRHNEEEKPFKPSIPPLTSPSHNRYLHYPTEFSAYVQDKMEFKDMIVNLGLRFDFFEPDGVVLADPADPNPHDPFKFEHRYKKYYDAATGEWKDIGPDMPKWVKTLPDSLLMEYTLEERLRFWYKEAKPKMQLSPRFGIAYPITDRGVIHFSYGHFFQIPLFEYLYANPDLEVPRTSGVNTIIGNADLNPQRTVMYEIGLQQQLSDDIRVDVTLFYRDIRDWVGTSPEINTAIPTVKYTKYENRDYSNVRGITVMLSKRYSHHFSFDLDYSFMIAEGSHSNPQDAFHDLRAGREPRIQLIPLNWDQRHTLNASVSVGTENWRISLLGKYRTGLPYTPTISRGTVVGTSAWVGWRENSERKPDIYSVDLRVYRAFKLGSVELALFAYVYNLFDQRNETGVFSDTGRATYTLDVRAVGADPNRISTLEDFVTRPDFYSEPRQIQIGLSVNF